MIPKHLVIATAVVLSLSPLDVGSFAAVSDAAAQVAVRGYTRRDGTYVAPHYRSSPNGTTADNYSTRGNTNPFTGERGTRSPDSRQLESFASPVALAPEGAPPARRESEVNGNGGPIPPQFHGEWNEDVASCGTGLNDSRLRIEATRMRFYESGGQVRGAFTQGPFEMIAVLDMSGEGETWIAAYHFVLASDGRYLTADDGSVLYRCP